MSVTGLLLDVPGTVRVLDAHTGVADVLIQASLDRDGLDLMVTENNNASLSIIYFGFNDKDVVNSHMKWKHLHLLDNISSGNSIFIFE